MSTNWGMKERIAPPKANFIVGYEQTRLPPPIGWTTPVNYWCTPTTYSEYEEIQRTWSMGHPGPPYTVGGPFHTSRSYSPYGATFSQGEYRVPGTYKWYIGSFYLHPRWSSFSSLLNRTTLGATYPPSYGDPSAYGPTAWNRYKPGRSTASLAQAIGESRDIPRMLQQSARGFHDLWKLMGGRRHGNSKALANQWLNTQFGWLPFITDLRKFYRTFNDLDRLYAQVKRENGQWVRRGGSVAQEVDSQILVDDTYSDVRPLLTTAFYPGGSNRGPRKHTLYTRKDVWFTARFRYWIPDIESPVWRRWYVAHLFGAIPNPSLVWELTPWSWLIDWFTNLGENFSNLTNGWADNLVAKHAYVMQTTSSEIDVTSSTTLSTGHVISGSETFVQSAKARAVACPFGFQLDWGDLSPRQLSILAALGVSRS